jgi:hypothetical protein
MRNKVERKSRYQGKETETKLQLSHSDAIVVRSQDYKHELLALELSPECTSLKPA